MARQARKFSKTGLYHVIFRGISRQNIFEEALDYEKLKEIIKKVKQEADIKIYAYCFMSNHVHLFLKETETAQISKIMKKILSHYATWFNIKYLRTGSLFGSRYKSEPVEDERYFLSLVRYIHQNPVKAGMVKYAGEYEYSSYNDYVDGESGITDVDFVLELFNSSKKKAKTEFIDFHGIVEEEVFEIASAQGKNTAEIRRIITGFTNGKNPESIKEMPKTERDLLIKKLVNEAGISKSALERATGISRGTIIRIVKS